MALINPQTGQPFDANLDPFSGQSVADPRNAQILQQDFLATVNRGQQQPAGLDAGAGAGPDPKSLTIESGQLANANVNDFLGNLQNPAAPDALTLDQAFEQTQGFFKPLDENEIGRIRSTVEAQFAPLFERQQKVNELRSNIERSQSAQRGQTGFGGGRLVAEGQGNVAQAGANALNQLNQQMQAEIQSQLATASGAKNQQTGEQLNFAQGLVDDQRTQAQRFFQNQLATSQESRLSGAAQFEKAANQLDLLSELGADQLAQFGVQDFAEIENALGLPGGFVSGIQAAKQKAATAESQEAVSELFNDGAVLATKLPQGQKFELQTPGGDTLSFVGTSPNEFQVISNKHGIFRVNKDTGETTKLTSFASGSGGGAGINPAVQSLVSSVLATIGEDDFVNTSAYKAGLTATAQAGIDTKEFTDALPQEIFLNPKDSTAKNLFGTRSQLFKDSGGGGGDEEFEAVF